MSTLNDLIASITASLHSYTGVHEQSTHLTAAIDADDLVLQVDASDQVMRGIAEIEDELIYVNSSDSNGLALPPYGRGYRGTTAAAHATNTQIIWDPPFPRAEVRRAVDQCVAGLYPTLYRIKSADITYEVLPIGFDLPTDCEDVLYVTFQRENDPYDYWAPIHHWSFNPDSPEANGKTLNLLEPLPAGATVRVVYQARFGAFSSGSDTLLSVGLEESYADLILYCVTARMVRFLDPARLQVRAVENLSRSSVVQTGDAGKVANQLYAMYQQRLGEERRRLLNTHPASIHFQR